MKSIIKVSALLGLALAAVSCSKMLDTTPTDKVSGTVIFADAKNAETAVNGIYRIMYGTTFTTANTTHAFAQPHGIIALEVMGDDMVMSATGSGWFMWDHDHSYRESYLSTGARPYFFWNMYYTYIANANYIIAEEGKIGGDPNLAKSVIAQAFAIRAWSYFQLVQIYSPTGADSKGVPVYTEPTRSGSEGKARGKVSDVYTQINADLDKALSIFNSLGKPVQTHSSNIDYYVAQGFKAKVALTEKNFDAAITAATAALSKPGMALMNATAITQGFNSKSITSALWVMEVIAAQSPNFGSYHAQMDSKAQQYAHTAPKCISAWLYDQMLDTDARKAAWFVKPVVGNSTTSGVESVNYQQKKHRYRDIATKEADLIFMRGEEMLLIKAEAMVRKATPDYAGAITELLNLAGQRQSAAGLTDYTAYVNGLAKAQTLNTVSTDAVTTLLDEIIVQKRIELWGEIGRVLEMKRLAVGMDRSYTGTNFLAGSYRLTKYNAKDPNSPIYTMTIPNSEFNGNANMDSNSDQNPVE